MLEAGALRDSERKRLRTGLARLGIELAANGCDQLLRYGEALKRSSAALGLLSRSDEQRVTERHLLDSLRLVPWLRHEAGGAIADIGSGGGLPGIPLALAFPERSVQLFERNEKKGRFLQRCVQQLALDNVTVHVEDAKHHKPSNGGAVEWIVSRAVATPEALWELVAGWFGPQGGNMLLMVGADYAGRLQTDGETLIRTKGKQALQIVVLDEGSAAGGPIVRVRGMPVAS